MHKGWTLNSVISHVHTDRYTEYIDILMNNDKLIDRYIKKDWIDIDDRSMHKEWTLGSVISHVQTDRYTEQMDICNIEEY